MQQFRETQELHKEAREELREAQKNLTEARRAFRSALETDATREREFQRARRELTEAFLPSHAPEVAGLYTSTMRRILSALRARNAQQLLLSAELAKAVLDRSAPMCESSESDAVETSCSDLEGADILTAGCNAESDDRSDLGAMSRLQGQQLYRDRSRSPRCPTMQGLQTSARGRHLLGMEEHKTASAVQIVTTEHWTSHDSDH